MRSVRDNLGRVKTATYTGGRTLTYSYTGDGQLYSVCDQKNENDPGVTYQYSYDSLGRLMSGSVIDSSGNVVFSTRQTYDSNNQLSGQQWRIGGTQYSESYTYGLTTGLLATHKPAVGNTLTFAYDALQRIESVKGGIYDKYYTYRDISGTDKTTTQVSQLKYDLPTDIAYSYTYDALGNIATYTEGGTAYAYSYDAQNQLTTVKTNDVVTHTYEYDAAGNITEATTPTGTHTYTYDTGVWKDLLKYFDGEEIVYDASGNPTTYYNGTEWDMDWAEGRRLVSASSGTTSLDFTYDSDGLRLTKKVNNSTTYHYHYAGGKLMRQTDGTNTLDFFYDSAGTPYALKYNGTLYYYITNLQGDVLHIVNTSGTPVVSYSYSPYGEIENVTGDLATSLGVHNPLRYRGYVYDEETELYYLQSRYYDPGTCRFINADGYASTGHGILGNNMFAYCNNNPVINYDPGGQALVASLKDEHDPTLGMFVGLTGGGGGGATYALSSATPAIKTVKEIARRVNNTNGDVTRADLATKGYGFFRGRLVIKLDIMDDAAFSFGVILTGPNPTDNLLAHEYGHTVHFDQIGAVDYAAKVALPSVISFWLIRPNPYYESQPWEYIAEYFGNTTPPSGGYLNHADEMALLYWLFTILT